MEGSSDAAATWSRLEHEAFRSLERPVDVGAAVGGALATGIPLAVGVAVDHRVLGLFCTLGALNTGLAVSSAPPAERTRWGALAVAGGTGAVGVATVTHDLAWLAVLVTFVWALLRVLGPAGALVGFTTTAVFVIVGGQVGGPGQAGQRMLWYVVGGVAGLAAMVLAAQFGPSDATGTGARGPAPREAHRALRQASPHGVVWHHAVRTAATAAAATVLYRALGLPFGYWVPLTTVAVLQPDSHGSAVRALQRGGGTIVGTAVVAIVSALTDNPAVLVGLVVISAAALFALQARGYHWTVVFLTPTALLMISTVQFKGWEIAADRVQDTAIGIALALLVLLVSERATRSRVR